MANKIQIKRSATTETPTSLNAGELAFSNVVGGSGVLFIGSTDGGTVVPIGGVRNPGVLTANQALVANTTSGIDKIITANLAVTSVWANGSSGSVGNLLYSNGSGVFWAAPAPSVSGSNTQIQFNDSGYSNAVSAFTFDKTINKLSVANIDTTTIYFGLSGSIDYANYTGTAYNANNATNFDGSNSTTWQGYITSNAAAAYTNATSYADTVAGTAYSNATSYADTKAGTAYSNATSYADTVAGTAYSNATSYADAKAANAYSNAMSDTLSRNGSYTGNNTFGGTNTVFNSNVVFGGSITSSITPAANVTYNIGTNSMRWNEIHASNVHSVTGYFDGNVEVAGDLIVSGNVTTTNVNSVIISDPLIYLAGNNYYADLVDIGFVGNYYDGANQRHTGVFRHASTDEYYVFHNLTQELSGNTVVDINDSSFQLSTLNTYLKSGGLVSNSSNVQITANSTVGVNITGNTLTLSTPLAGTSGGTGLNTYTAEDILVANATNGFRKLNVGTEGYVLQVSSGVVAWNSLDGGTF
jgi:hypothetical protein